MSASISALSRPGRSHHVPCPMRWRARGAHRRRTPHGRIHLREPARRQQQRGNCQGTRILMSQRMDTTSVLLHDMYYNLIMRSKKVPHPIPYQGSKRNLAKYILPFFPQDVDTLFEPFAGSAAISIVAALNRKAASFYINDVNAPLVALWDQMINHPKRISEQYKHLWLEQQGHERKYYDFVRDEFNKTKRPDYLLYLLARCVKASVRYNAYGEFNQSPDNRRLGRNPELMATDIFAVSKLLVGKTVLDNRDYKNVLKLAKPTDLIYMDPPYQGVCATGDPRYFSGINFDEFMQELQRLIKRNVPFILSYDGRTGQKSYGQSLPEELGMYRLELDAGRSTQATLLGRDDKTYESVYLSGNLVQKLDLEPVQILANHTIRQPALFEF